ncbi:MAG: hypothetical protein ACJ8KO_06775 [Sulfurifustaceae bacterium]
MMPSDSAGGKPWEKRPRSPIYSAERDEDVSGIGVYFWGFE